MNDFFNNQDSEKIDSTTVNDSQTDSQQIQMDFFNAAPFNQTINNENTKESAFSNPSQAQQSFYTTEPKHDFATQQSTNQSYNNSFDPQNNNFAQPNNNFAQKMESEHTAPVSQFRPVIVDANQSSINQRENQTSSFNEQSRPQASSQNFGVFSNEKNSFSNQEQARPQGQYESYRAASDFANHSTVAPSFNREQNVNSKPYGFETAHTFEQKQTEQPTYSAPQQNSYVAPQHNSFTAQQPSYSAPQQPSYSVPQQPSYSAPQTQQSAQPTQTGFSFASAQQTAVKVDVQTEKAQLPYVAPTMHNQVVTPTYCDVKEEYTKETNPTNYSIKNQSYQAVAPIEQKPNETVNNSQINYQANNNPASAIRTEEVASFFTPVASDTRRSETIDINVVPKKSKKELVQEKKAEKLRQQEELKQQKLALKNEKLAYKEEQSNSKKGKVEVEKSVKSKGKVTTKASLSTKNKPVGFFKMLSTQILFMIPVVGLISMLICLIRPKCNKNTKSVALTSFVWTLVIYSLIGAFVYFGGVGYILEFLEVRFAWTPPTITLPDFSSFGF